MRFTHPRAEWQDPKLPVVGPAIDWTRIDTAVPHYTAADNLIDGDPGEHANNLPGYLRAIQRDYQLNRGYSIGYNVAVDWLGGSWELRGDTIKCAANKGHNEHTFAILVLVDGNDMATEYAAAEIRRLIGEAETLARRELAITGHGQLQNPNHPTGCPGTGLRAQITLGEFSPRWVDPNRPVPPPIEITPPIITEAKMLIIVGNEDNHDDPRRWVWDGGTSLRYLNNEAEYTRLLDLSRAGVCQFHPVFSTLASPFWMPTAERSQYGQH